MTEAPCLFILSNGQTYGSKLSSPFLRPECGFKPVDTYQRQDVAPFLLALSKFI